MKRALNMILAASLLISTMGIVVSKHFCGKKLVGISVITSHGGCCDTGRPMPPGCCHNENDVHQLDENSTTMSPLVLSPIQLSVVTFFLPLKEMLSESPFLTKVFYKNFKPPLLHADISSWVQTYLI